MLLQALQSLKASLQERAVYEHRAPRSGSPKGTRSVPLSNTSLLAEGALYKKLMKDLFEHITLKMA